uniref:Uncharacterized protein n=1 Tax=Maylandia zebra TaxID=106582 RepID=A0A3P9DP59_9CICH
MREFLEKVPVVLLSESHRKELNNPVTQEEVRLAINSLKGGKVPGPDGFCPEFYKKLNSFKNEQLPPTLRQANILLILKKNKCPDRCESYRPISLINVDAKLLSKLLVRRLEGILPLLINLDQTGFIQNRFSSTNIRRLLNTRKICISCENAVWMP